jgi:hypothetical protein
VSPLPPEEREQLARRRAERKAELLWNERARLREKLGTTKQPTKPALVWEEGIGPLGTFEAEIAGGSYYHIHLVVCRDAGHRDTGWVARSRGDVRRESYQVWVVLRDKRGRKRRMNLGNVPTFQQAKEFCERDYAERKD